MAQDEKDGVLSRWSKRKLAVEEETEEEPSEVVAEQDDEREAMLLANQEAAEAIDLDTIDEDSDLSLFMKEGVPEALKRRALSTLWRSNPVFANVDGLVDYDDDFGNPDLIMKTFKSAYQVGKGYFEEEAEETEEQSVAEAEMEPEEVDDPVEEEITEEEAVEVVEEETTEEAESSEPEVAAAEEEPEPDLAPAPKVSLRRRLTLEG